MVQSTAMAPDRQRILTNTNDRTAMVWELPALTVGRRITCTITAIDPMVLAPDRGWLAHAHWPHHVELWDVVRDRRLADHEVPGPHVEGRQEFFPYPAMILAPDGDSLVVCGANGHVWIISAATGECRRSFAAHDAGINAAITAPDGSWLATGGDDGRVKLWDGNNCIEAFEVGGPVTSLTMPPDGAWLAAGSGDGTATVWNPPGGGEARRLAEQDGAVETVAASADGRYLATGTRVGTITVWEVETGRAVTLMRVDSPIDTCYWFDEDRGLLVFGTRGNYVFTFG